MAWRSEMGIDAIKCGHLWVNCHCSAISRRRSRCQNDEYEKDAVKNVLFACDELCCDLCAARQIE